MIALIAFKDLLQSFLSGTLMAKYKFSCVINVRINFSLDVNIYTDEGHFPDEYNLLKEFTSFVKQTAQDLESDNSNLSHLAKGLKPYLNNLSEYIHFYIYPIEERMDDPNFTNGIDTNWSRDDYPKLTNNGPRARFRTLIEEQDTREWQELRKNLPPVVTFYSYKGGVGRTTTTVAYALHLASKGKRVAIIDCDLEAPGYINFFNLENQIDLKLGQKNGLVEFLSDASLANYSEEIPIDSYVITPNRTDVSEEQGAILDNIFIIPGGNLNDSLSPLTDSANDLLLQSENRNAYLEGLSRISLSNTRILVQGLQLLLSKIAKVFEVDIILIDSRTGFNDIMGVSTLCFSSYLVAFFGLSAQNWPGMKQLVSNYYRINKQRENNKCGFCIVNSILPNWGNENKPEWISNKQKDIEKYLLEFNSQGELPKIYDLRRQSVLEVIGVGQESQNQDFMEMVETESNEDYIAIFNAIDSSLDLSFEKETDIPAIEEWTLPEVSNDAKESILPSSSPKLGWNTRRLSNYVLRRLQFKLRDIKNFAEEGTTIGADQFLYRNCMAELYNTRKIIIQGYKGAGKTYLYRALGDPKIGSNNQDEIRKLIKNRSKQSINDKRGNYIDPDSPSMFINVISTGAKGDNPLENISQSDYTSGKYDFRRVWLIMMWNALISHEDFAEIKQLSALKDYAYGDMTGYNALVKIEEITNQGARAMAEIENDLDKINSFLLRNGDTHLFVMYDRLDSIVEPKFWTRGISPLINMWRENLEKYSNIHPKIFIRTDLFPLISGTNTERLKHNIVNIDWNIEDVFGYFSKLLYSDPESWESLKILYTDRLHRNPQFIKTTEISMENGYGQIQTHNEAALLPLVNLFFGKTVTTTKPMLSPWEYFRLELSNALGIVCLRPFINMLNKCALEKAIADPRTYKQAILNPEIYASRETRIEAANSYFEDLSSDLDFSEDLKSMRDFLMSDQGAIYRFKTLSESQFNNFLRDILQTKVESMTFCKNIADLQRLLFSSGVMAELIKPGKKFYQFARMYWYAWGLKNSSIDKEEDQIHVSERTIEAKENEWYSGEIHKGNPGIIRPQLNAGEKLVMENGKSISRFIFIDKNESINSSDDILPVEFQVQYSRDRDKIYAINVVKNEDL